MTGNDLPLLRTTIPGPRSRERVDVLARHECPAITARRARRAATLGAADDDPIVWDEAAGANVVDVDGNRFVDLTSGFGVAFVGHRHPDVVAAAERQAAKLLHAMGDAWPDATRIELLRRLAAVTPGALDVAILGLSGSDAVEAAVKTAVLATGRSGVLAFDGAYHGLSLGALPLQGYRSAFTEPFGSIVHPAVHRLPWGAEPEDIESVLATHAIGLVLAEPIQGRGGMRPPPPDWLALVAELARGAGALFALDEIQTGLGRTGTWFACQHDGIEPDLLCIGKSLAGGFPLSACLGTPAVMDAWGASTGEALHTQTFLGHPIGCAAALAVLEVIERDDLCDAARRLGEQLRVRLEASGFAVRGRGLMLGVHVPNALAVSRALLRQGFLVLPTGRAGDSLGLTPPVCLSEEQVDAFVLTLAGVA